LFVHRDPIVGYDRPDEYLFLTLQYDTVWHSNLELNELQNFEHFLTALKPDIVHFQHFLFAGMETILIARKVLPHAKIVMTLHEFAAICLSDGHMIKQGSRELCQSPSPFRCSDCYPHIAPAVFARRRIYTQDILSQVDHFVVPSHFLGNRFKAWGLPDNKITFIDNGRTGANDPLPDEPRQTRNHHNRFGFTGQLIEAKGGLVVLEAVDILRRRGFENFYVYIYGANLAMAPEAFRKRIENPDDELHENLTFKGSYSGSQIGQVMKTLDWVLVPSIWWENAPMVIQEAFMHRKPVICSNIGGMAEKVRHMVDGLQFNVRDPYALADTMQLAVEDEQIYPKLIAGIKPVFSARESARQHKKLYANLGMN
jgi:glycosyltransferase involved in cell wall biosynthesis